MRTIAVSDALAYGGGTPIADHCVVRSERTVARMDRFVWDVAEPPPGRSRRRRRRQSSATTRGIPAVTRSPIAHTAETALRHTSSHRTHNSSAQISFFLFYSFRERVFTCREADTLRDSLSSTHCLRLTSFSPHPLDKPESDRLHEKCAQEERVRYLPPRPLWLARSRSFSPCQRSSATPRCIPKAVRSRKLLLAGY